MDELNNDPTLFESDRDKAIRDIVEQFKAQLNTATSPEERAALKLAIRSWMASLDSAQRTEITKSAKK